MKDLVIIKSKTINNESVPVTLEEIEPLTGEEEVREITRPVIFRDFQAEVPLKQAQFLVKKYPTEFSIVGAKDEEATKEVKRVLRVAQEKIKGFGCEICGAEAKSKAGLLCHIRYAHPEKWEGKKTLKK